MAILQKCSDLAWGPFTLLLLVLFSGWLTVKSKAVFILKSPIAVKKLMSKKPKGDITPFMTLSNALAATMGTGNIVGVASAIAAGGPGALFWMQAAALFGMMIKFSEAALSVKFRAYGAGPMGYLKRIKYIGKILALLFAVSCAAASIGSGCITQSNSAAGALQRLSVSPLISAAVFGIFCWMATNGGVKGIMRLTCFMIPFITVGYMVMAVFVIIKCRTELANVFEDILKSAFCFRAISGGAAGYTVKQALRYGLSRGIFSNEAGMGSSSIAYSLSGDDDIYGQGMLAIAEVFIDTVICCSMTGLVILLSGCSLNTEDGATMAINAFSISLGSFFGDATAVFIALFGIASVCGWFTYGYQAIKAVFGRNKFAVKTYQLLYSVCAAAGALISAETVWMLSDVFTGIMLLINILGMILLIDEIKKIIYI